VTDSLTKKKRRKRMTRKRNSNRKLNWLSVFSKKWRQNESYNRTSVTRSVSI